MCWISKNKPVKKIAEEDIPVFKILKTFYSDEWANSIFENCKIDLHGLRSIYTNFEYKIGTEYSTEIRIIINSLYRIGEGFHSYHPNCEIIFDYYEGTDTKYIAITYHNIFLDTLPIFCDIKLIKANCIIPKGSEYYLNEEGEYVSDKIKICNKNKILE